MKLLTLLVLVVVVSTVITSLSLSVREQSLSVISSDLLVRLLISPVEHGRRRPMAKSRNRSRDARKRAAKKRKNREYQARKLQQIAKKPGTIALYSELERNDGTR
jgi:hypothetical protein